MDRDRDRRRDFPPEDQFRLGRGQSYRPGGARERSPLPPPLADTYRARSPPRRSDYLGGGDSYRAPRQRSRTPPPRRDEYRRRSPTPPRYRDREPPRGGDSYRGRPRSPLPPRREDLPRDDLFRRDPARDERDYRDVRDYRDERGRAYAPPAARSPLPLYRERSPHLLKRGREPSPVSSRGRRTPPPAKRERIVSPPRVARYEEYAPSRGVSPPRRRYSPDIRDRRPSPPRAIARDYHPRSRSPLARNDRVDQRAVDEWRRPRSPVRDSRQEYLSREESAANSAATSRRSSPPIHPSRAVLQPHPSDDRPRSSRASPRDPYSAREPYRVHDVEPKPHYSLPMREPSAYEEDDSRYSNDVELVQPAREPPRREVDVAAPRAPPTGPSSQRAVSSSMAPPTGPAAATAPSGPRATVAPPAGPRGAPVARGDFAARGRGSFSADFSPRGRGAFGAPFRGGRGGGPSAGPGLGRGDLTSQPDPAGFGSRPPPSGPRSSLSQTSPSTFRQSSSIPAAAPTYPRGAGPRFANGDTNTDVHVPTGPKARRRPTDGLPMSPALASRPHPALADLPKYIEEGKKADPLVDRTKLHKLEDEAEKLRRQIEEKEARKRKTLREWDRIARETDAAALRSDLAEQALRQLNGEAESQAAF